MAFRTVAITGSYRKGGITHQAVDLILRQLESRGHITEMIDLLDHDISFCTNCRQCMQTPGPDLGVCPFDDAMSSIIDKIEAADCLVFAAPVNLGSVTAIFKRFMERLAVYADWPWGKPSPILRKRRRTKPVILLTSTAMPAIMARFFTSAMKSLNYTAKIVGGRPVATLFTGYAAASPRQTLSPRQIEKISKAVAGLAGQVE